MNFNYYIKKKKYNHSIFLKTNNNNIIFNCREKSEKVNEVHLKFNINCSNVKIINDEIETLFNKQQIILNNGPYEYLKDEDQFDLFEIYRYKINNIKYKKNLDEPVLCLSLFFSMNDLINIRQNPLNNNTLIINFTRYIYPQIKLLLSWRYYFPLSNIIYYIDNNLIELFENNNIELQNFLSYSLNKIFKSELSYLLNNDDDNFNNYITQIIRKLREYKNYNFDNFLNRYLFYINIIYSSDYNNLNESENYSIIYSYKLNKFNNIENYEYMGQIIRYLSLTINKNRHKHFIWRDGHHVILSSMEAEWIKSFNNIGRNNKEELYLLPISSQYCRPWHDIIKSNIDNKYYQLAPLAGMTIQMCNFTDSQYFFNIDTYIQTIGIPFLLDKDNNLILYNNCPYLYNYGLDEYILSSFLFVNYIKKKTIYSKPVRITNILNMSLEYYNEVSISFMLLFIYLYDNYSLLKYDNNKTTLKMFINSIEILRKNIYSINVKYFNKIVLLLSIVPTIYNIPEAITEDATDELRYNIYNNEIIINNLIDNILNILDELYNIKIKKDKLYKAYSSKKILSKLNINWATSIINTTTEWNTLPYYKNINSKKYNIYPGLYLSGIYSFKLPDNISIIRCPNDLTHAYNVLKRKGSIELTDYKLQNDVLTENIKNKLNKYNFKDINKGIIKKDIISKLLDIDKEEIKTKIYSSIIWRILLKNHYNIPVEFIRLRKKLKIEVISAYNIIYLVNKYSNKKNYIIKTLFKNQNLERIHI